MNNLNKLMLEFMKYAKYTHPDYPFLGLNEETGEFTGVIAKLQRKHGFDWRDYIDDETRLLLRKELGDVFWMWLAVSLEIGENPDEVVEALRQKLKDRAQRGVIIGKGDNR